MKRNKLFILGICTVMVALVSLSLVSGTWAKYTSTVSGEDSARVAKWAWTYKGGNVLTEQIKVDLFETYTDANVDTDGAGNEVVIAPGTKGSFKFGFKNESEVNARYQINYTVTNVNSIPVQFSVDGGTTWTDNLANIPWKNINMGQEIEEIEVQWQWVFEVDDSQDLEDTGFGIDAVTNAAEITVAVEVVFEQVD